jgi:Tfp pilus assembly protein PilV
MRLFQVTRKFSTFEGREGGVTLLETMLALAILGIVVVGFFSALTGASKSTFTADRQNSAQSLGQSQMEHVKHSPYINFSDPEHEDYELIATPEGYTVETSVTPIDPDTGQALPSGQDLGLQKVIITTRHYGESVFTLETYKGER